MADVDELRARRDRVEQRVEVVAVVAQRDAHRARAELDRVEDVARERRPAADDLVALVEHGLAEAVDDAVGSRADRDLLEADAVLRGERGAQRPRAAVGIAVQLARAALERFDALPGKARKGPSFEASLTTRSRPSSRWTSSTGFPGSYGTRSAIERRKNRPPLAQTTGGVVVDLLAPEHDRRARRRGEADGRRPPFA